MPHVVQTRLPSDQSPRICPYAPLIRGMGGDHECLALRRERGNRARRNQCPSLREHDSELEAERT